MNEKELKRLGRGELLELLLVQTNENERLKAELDFVQKQLNDRRFVIDNAGSIADATLTLSKVFEAAQSAADEYLENVRLLSERQEKDSTQLYAQAQVKSEGLLADTEQRCEQMKIATAQQCEAMLKKAKSESETYWAEVTQKLDSFLRQRTELREFLTKPKSTN